MSIFIMILLLGLLIFVHEAGHFFAARAFGIKVERFGFGLPFGPTIFKKQCGDIEVVVHAFLLGGYVSFPDDDKDCDLPADSEDRFANKPLWQRAIVVSAGVIANVLCAFLLVLFVAAYSKHLPSGNYEIYAGEISAPKGASIWDSGIKTGDRILNANGTDVNNAYTFVTIVKNSAKNNGIVSLETIDKNYDLLKGLNPGLEKDEIIPEELSVRLPEGPVADIISMDKYAAKGAKYFKKNGIKIDDNIQSLKKEIGNKTVYISNGKYSLYDLAKAISDGNHPINIIVARDGQEVKLNPIYPDEKGLIGLGLASKQTLVDTKTPVAMIKESNHYLWDNTATMVYSLGQLFTGNIPMKDLHGVVAITKIGGDMIDKAGKSSGILLAALISMNLAILNILPIPALDGGHLMFMLAEKIMGKPLDEKIIEKISSVFFSLLILLMIFVIFNDIILLISK
ncbi:MAG: RIP metalloprotease RseP [Candidatus Gastranaerophilales bacterium]|nr:RIP metalloprotease RseP [Candidatus Gastranaerophilales bacterium]MCM1073358.1 RIP metalloprotease RseP [Bacteroides sp.]